MKDKFIILFSYRSIHRIRRTNSFFLFSFSSSFCISSLKWFSFIYDRLFLFAEFAWTRVRAFSYYFSVILSFFLRCDNGFALAMMEIFLLASPSASVNLIIIILVCFCFNASFFVFVLCWLCFWIGGCRRIIYVKCLSDL